MSIDLELWRMRIGLLEAQRYSYLRRAARKAAARDCAGRSAEHRSGRRVSGNAGRRWLGIAVVALITALSLLMRTGDVEAKSRLLDLNQVAENHFIERYCLNTVRCQNWNEVARGWWVFQSSTERADGFSLLQTCLLVVRMLLIMSGDVEQNPGPLTTQACHLDINDLRVVKNELMDATTKWYDIGLELGLSPGILGEIERQESHLPTCLRKMLSHWLKTTSPFPTWEALATVLESRAVGESHLALRLREEYCKPPETKPTLDQDEGSQLKLLVPIRSFSEGANYAAGETSGEDIQFPHLDTAGLSCEEKETLKGRLIAESRDIMLKFQKLVNKIQKSLDERKVPIPTLASHLCSLGAFTSVMATKPLLEECLPEIRAASNTEDAFWILRDYFSFFNYHIIEHIIHELGTDDDQRQFYMYMEAFKEYSKRRCIEFPRALQLGCPNKKGHVKFCVKLDIHFKHYRIEELQAFRSWLSTTLHVSEGALHLCFIGEGCIQFIFQIPLFVKEAIFPLSPEQERALLEKGIVEVECCEYKFAKKFGGMAPMYTTAPKRKDCAYYKLLGRCRFGENCRFRHDVKAEITHEDYVSIPEEVPVSLVVGSNLRSLLGVGECVFELSDKREREVKVVSSDPQQLMVGKEKLRVLLSQLYPLGPSWCYFHTDGISEVIGKVFLQFREYEGRAPGYSFEWQHPRRKKMYEVCLYKTYGSQHYQETSLEDLEKLNLEATASLHSTLDTLHGTHTERQISVDEAVKTAKKVSRARIMIEYRERITEKVHDALSWILENRNPLCTAKLEARFGKLLWHHLSYEVHTSPEPWELDKFAEFVFCDTNHSRLFNPNVQFSSVDTLCKELERASKSKSVIETLDVKVFAARNVKIDMRIKIEADGQTKIVAVRKNERKVVTFDILCLHRQHDIRLSLSQLEIMPPTDALYPLVEDVFRSITFLDPETLTLVPCTEDWTVSFLRRKRKMSFNLDQKYIVTVSYIQEYRTHWEKLVKGEMITVRLEKFTKPHVEVEFHNVKWQVAFGKDVGFSPEESLLLHMDPPHVDPALLSSIPYPWNTETIGEDLEEVMKHLDTLNESLGKA